MSSVTFLSKVKIDKCTEIKADNEKRQSEPQQTARVLSLINHILSLSDKRLSGPLNRKQERFLKQRGF